MTLPSVLAPNWHPVPSTPIPLARASHSTKPRRSGESQRLLKNELLYHWIITIDSLGLCALSAYYAVFRKDDHGNNKRW